MRLLSKRAHARGVWAVKFLRKCPPGNGVRLDLTHQDAKDLLNVVLAGVLWHQRTRDRRDRAKRKREAEVAKYRAEHPLARNTP